MARSPRLLLGVFCLVVTAFLLFLFSLDPLAVQEAARPAHERVASVLEGLKGWSWASDSQSEAELDREAALEVIEGRPPSVAATGHGELTVDQPSQVDNELSGVVAPVPDDGPDDDEAATVASPPSLAPSPRPPCRRTLLFKFGGTRGFASEYNRFIRIAAVAAHFNYEVVPFAMDWMYGSHLDYFKLPESACSTGDMPSWKARKPIYATTGEKLEAPAWTKHDHVQDGGYNALDYVDEVFLALAAERKSVDRLHKAEIDSYPPPLPLSGLETVHPVMMEAFRMQAAQVARFWVLSDAVQTMVDALRAALKWEDRLVVGMHIRLGDKCSETGSVKYSPLRFATPAQRAALSGGARGANICKDQAASGGLDAEHADVYLKAAEIAAGALQRAGGVVALDPTPLPLLAVMSDDARALHKLQKSGGERVDAFDRVMLREAASAVPDALGGEGGVDMAELESGFRAGSFHELTPETRITATRRFVRDLTIIGANADAFVFTGSSNVGRLTALIGGAEKAKLGRFISCDTRWFGTAHFT